MKKNLLVLAFTIITGFITTSFAGDIIVDKVIILTSPIADAPYFISCTAMYRSFESKPVTSAGAFRGNGSELPLGITVPDADGSSWIKVEVRIDKQKENVSTSGASEKHTALFQIGTSSRNENKFIAYKNGERGFVYKLYFHKK